MLEILIENYKPIGKILLITSIIIIIYTYIFSKLLKEHIKENWVYYRSNPLLLPIAGFINPPDDMSATEFTKQNITGVIWGIVSKFLNILMIPIYPILQLFVTAIKSISDIMNKMRNQMAVMRNFLFKIFEQMYMRLETSVAAITFYFLKLREELKRSFGVLNLMTSTVQHSFIFFQSLLNGPVGKLGEIADAGGMAMSIFTFGLAGIPVWQKSLCFHPHTLIKTNDGATKRIMDIQIGEKLHSNNQVLAIINAKVSTPMYKIHDIIVSGDHKIQYKDEWIRVKNHPDARLAVYYEPNVICFITSSSIIEIGRSIFRDYLDEHSLTKYSTIQHMIEKHLNKNSAYQSTDNYKDYISGIEDGLIVEPSNICGTVSIASTYLHMYSIKGFVFAAKTLILYNGIYIRVHDHPLAEYIGKTNKVLKHYITTDGIIRFKNSDLVIRDFCEINDKAMSDKLDTYMDE